MKKILKKVMIISVLVYVGIGLILFIFQKNYIYFPSDQDFESCKYFQDSQKINIGGTRAYYKENSKKLIVFYHGNAGSACDRSFLKDKFQELGYSSIFVEYSGYSNDSRKPSRELLIKDVENINEFLKNIEYDVLTLAGESLGSSLASYHSSIAREDKLILISPFYSISDVAKRHYGTYPVSLMIREKYNSSEWVDDVSKVVVIHGAKDKIIPISHGKKLFEKINTNNKEFIEIEGAGHNDLYYFPETFEAISNFLQSDNEQ